MFSIFDTRETERQLLKSSFESFLKMGTTFVVLSTTEKNTSHKQNVE